MNDATMSSVFFFADVGRFGLEGGVIMDVIVVASVIGWTLAVMKWMALRPEGRRNAGWAQDVIVALRDGRPEQVHEILSSRDCGVARALRAGLAIPTRDREVFDRRIEPVLMDDETRLHRPLALIATIGAIMPLLGLLGTVLGMIKSFQVIGVEGSQEAPALATGVSEALLTTQAGLVAGLPLVLVHGYLEARARRGTETARVFAGKLRTVRCG